MARNADSKKNDKIKVTSQINDVVNSLQTVFLIKTEQYNVKISIFLYFFYLSLIYIIIISILG